MTTPWTLDDKRVRLDDLATLGPDWDGYGAKAILPESIAGMQVVLPLLAAAGLPCPSVHPTPDGGVQCEWNEIDGEIKCFGSTIFAWLESKDRVNPDAQSVDLVGPIEEAPLIVRMFAAGAR